MIGTICREYRLSKNVPLSELSINTKYKTLYSFESGLSTNYEHITPYLELAEKHGEVETFIAEIMGALKNG